jgi:hypothetical protein
MGKMVIFIVLLLAPNSWGINYKTGTCEESGFSDDAWVDISSQEPRLMQELNSIATASGQVGEKVGLTNCRVEWPVDENGRMVSGYQTAILHKVWYKGTENPPVRKEGGMRIIWYQSREETQVGGTIYITTKRRIHGFTICRSEPVCAALNIFGKATTNPPIEGSLLRSR